MSAYDDEHDCAAMEEECARRGDRIADLERQVEQLGEALVHASAELRHVYKVKTDWKHVGWVIEGLERAALAATGERSETEERG